MKENYETLRSLETGHERLNPDVLRTEDKEEPVLSLPQESGEREDTHSYSETGDERLSPDVLRIEIKEEPDLWFPQESGEREDTRSYSETGDERLSPDVLRIEIKEEPDLWLPQESGESEVTHSYPAVIRQQQDQPSETDAADVCSMSCNRNLESNPETDGRHHEKPSVLTQKEHLKIKGNEHVTDFSKNEQTKSDEDATQMSSELTREKRDLRDEIEETELDVFHFPACATHCFGACCMDLSRPCQPDDPEVLKSTKKVQGTGSSQHVRSVQLNWFKDFNWLTLCETQSKLFCTPCRFCGIKGLHLSKRNEGAFTVGGFQNWKHAVRAFREHEKAQSHREATAKMLAFVSHQPKTATLVDSQLETQQKYNREMLIKQLTSLRFLMGQGLATEGHDFESGNLYQLMQLRSEDCPDLSHWLSVKKYMSRDIINELIHLFAMDIIRRLLSKVHEAAFYAILADKTRDIANREQLVTLFRWVDENYTVHEDFIGLVDLPNTDDSTIYSVLNDVLIRCNMPLALCRGQTYDGTADMSGHIRNVAAQFKRRNPAALHIYCFAQCINLCLQDVGKNCKAVQDALDLVLEVTCLIKRSSKRNHLFEFLKRELIPERQNPSTLSPTRWTIRTGAVKSIIDNYSVLCTVMAQIDEESHDEYGRRACAILAMLEKFSTFYGLRLSYLVFSATEQLAKTLQTVNTTLQDAKKAVKLTQEFLLQQRSKQACESFYASVTEAATDLTDAPVLPRHQRSAKRLEKGEVSCTFQSPAEYYTRQYFDALDLLAYKLTRRFNQKDIDVAIDLEKLLLTAAKGDNITFAPTTLELYASDFDFVCLRTQLKMLPNTIRAFGNEPTMVLTIRSISEAMNTVPMAKKLLPEVHKLLRLYYTIPVTMATVERCFSILHHVKNYLRCSMTQMRLNDLMCAYSHKEALAQTDVTAMATEFAQRNDRRRAFFANFDTDER
ncbi:zinc finger MYM-type protein 1-like isoform X2 [Rhinatrema bivittatum]|nr:zinc finger MYM-type protein 1-like isoform X2 [Rhinatrema bivittatum]